MSRKELEREKTSSRQRRSRVARRRRKLSATVAAENLSFLEDMVRKGRSGSMSEAVDMAIARLRRIENRARLEAATAGYFASLDPHAEAEERSLAEQLHASSESLNFENEP